MNNKSTHISGTYRLDYLDGLRGVAILFVVLFHAFSRWPEIVPYGSEFAQFPLFRYGGLGVQLFFMISGFVIFMSLERSKSFYGFMIRRWIRLFPAMLTCSLFIYLTAPFFPERPSGAPVLRDILPGVTFIDPYWWQVILGSPQGQLEGVFWSLYVEIKLYLVAGIFYFLIGGKKMIWVMLGLFLVAVIAPFFNQVLLEHELNHLKSALYFLSGKPCGWFASGALFYRYHNENKKWLLIAAIVVALVAAMSQGRGDYGRMLFYWERAYAAIFVVLIFTVATLSHTARRILSGRIILLIGFISYPLYLLHENMMVSLIVQIYRALPWIPSLLIPVIPITFVSAIAWLVARYVEPPARSQLKNWWLKAQTIDLRRVIKLETFKLR